VVLGRGARTKIERALESMGTNVLTVYSASRSVGGARGAMGAGSGLNDGDVEAIRNECDAVREVAPEVEEDAQIVWNGDNWKSEVRGVTPEYLSMRGWPLESGEFFGQRDLDALNKVCVLGRGLADQLGPVGFYPAWRASRLDPIVALKAD